MYQWKWKKKNHIFASRCIVNTAHQKYTKVNNAGTFAWGQKIHLWLFEVFLPTVTTRYSRCVCSLRSWKLTFTSFFLLCFVFSTFSAVYTCEALLTYNRQALLDLPTHSVCLNLSGPYHRIYSSLFTTGKATTHWAQGSRLTPRERSGDVEASGEGYMLG